jgi:methylglutaconyl-CoA hydratase
LNDTNDHLIQLTVDGAVARIRVCAPDTRNAFTTAMMRDFVAALESADAEGAALIVVEADGEDFSVGRAAHEQGVSLEEGLGQAIDTNRAWTHTDAVTLTVVNGAALGFAFGLVAQSDLTIAAADAHFAFDEMARGFVPKIVLSYLPERLPRSLALDLVLTARSIGAEEARELGLLGQVVPASELKDRAAAYVSELVDGGRAALLRDAKDYARRATSLPPSDRAAFALTESLRSMAP